MKNEKQKKNPVSIVLLTAAVLISLLLLGLYAWKNAAPPKTGDDNDTGPDTAIGTITPISVPTAVYKPTEALSPIAELTEIPSVTPTQEAAPTKKPSPTPRPEVTPMPRPEFQPVKALYLKPGSFQDSSRLDHYIDLANRTEINAYVIDIKSDWGMITYKSGIDDVIAAKACSNNIDIRKIIKNSTTTISG